ncbi:hypothetical protein NE237_011693 [Protea cynaroides]|uniref:F-box domain-containing protein n=1 Tax=Protea cynaroides TaxID=273540 RepID=A0A9Q0GYP4_9MAGN|nr:hypothetical protein NE237_011693 [Protea cynaroides]
MTAFLHLYYRREPSRKTTCEINSKVEEEEMEQGSTTNLYDLPECCIADILSRICTSPRDACRLSTVSSIFRSMTDSDSVWERFLPSDIQQILSSSVSLSLPNFSSKKEQFLHLSDNPLLIDNGTKTFSLEKCSGKKCYMIGAKELFIVWAWGNTPMAWKWTSVPESRFSEVAELVEVYWLDIHGRMETRLLSPNTTYVAYMVFKLTVLAYGLQNKSVETIVRLASGARIESERGEGKSVILQRPVERKWEGELPEGTEANSVPEIEVPKERGDGWMEIEMGEFFNERDEYGEIDMILLDFNSCDSKSGLIIQGIEIRPKVNQLMRRRATRKGFGSSPAHFSAGCRRDSVVDQMTFSSSAAPKITNRILKHFYFRFPSATSCF